MTMTFRNYKEYKRVPIEPDWLLVYEPEKYCSLLYRLGLMRFVLADGKHTRCIMTVSLLITRMWYVVTMCQKAMNALMPCDFIVVAKHVSLDETTILSDQVGDLHGIVGVNRLPKNHPVLF